MYVQNIVLCVLVVDYVCFTHIDPENGSSIFLRNVDLQLQLGASGCCPLQVRTQYSTTQCHDPEDYTLIAWRLSLYGLHKKSEKLESISFCILLNPHSLYVRIRKIA
jgi:hypothetical protein